MSLESVFANPPNLVGLANKESGEEAKERTPFFYDDEDTQEYDPDLLSSFTPKEEPASTKPAEAAPMEEDAPNDGAPTEDAPPPMLEPEPQPMDTDLVPNEQAEPISEQSQDSCLEKGAEESDSPPRPGKSPSSHEGRGTKRRHRSHHKSHRRSRRHSHRRSHSPEDEEAAPQLDKMETPTEVPGSDGQQGPVNLEDLEDGELEDGEIDEEVPDDGPPKLSPQVPIKDESDSESDAENAAKDTDKKDENISPEGQDNEPKKKANKKTKKRKKRKERKEKAKKNKPKYHDHDRMDEEDGKGGWGPGFPQDGFDPRSRGNKSPPGPYDSPYDSPPGPYDSPSDEDDYGPPAKMMRKSPKKQSMLSMLSGEYVENSLSAHEKEEMLHHMRGGGGMSAGKMKKMEKSRLYKEMQQRQRAEKKNVPPPRQRCKFYMEGKCAKGKNCAFSHDFKPPRKTEVCKFYINDMCAKGKDCVYMHSDYPCKYFHMGQKCLQGDECRFSHDPLDEHTRPIFEKICHEDQDFVTMMITQHQKSPNKHNNQRDYNNFQGQKQGFYGGDYGDDYGEDYGEDYGNYGGQGGMGQGGPPMGSQPPPQAPSDLKKIPSLFDIEVFPPTKPLASAEDDQGGDGGDDNGESAKKGDSGGEGPGAGTGKGDESPRPESHVGPMGPGNMPPGGPHGMGPRGPMPPSMGGPMGGPPPRMMGRGFPPRPPGMMGGPPPRPMGGPPQAMGPRGGMAPIRPPPYYGDMPPQGGPMPGPPPSMVHQPGLLGPPPSMLRPPHMPMPPGMHPGPPGDPRMAPIRPSLDGAGFYGGPGPAEGSGSHSQDDTIQSPEPEPGMQPQPNLEVHQAGMKLGDLFGLGGFEDHEGGDVPANLPPRQRELFLRIQQQQRQNVPQDEQGGNDQDQAVEDDNWYSSDEEESGGPKSNLASILKTLNQGNAKPQGPQPTSAMPFDIAKVLNVIQSQPPPVATQPTTSISGNHGLPSRDPRQASAAATTVTPAQRPDPRVRNNARLDPRADPRGAPRADPRVEARQDPRVEARQDPRSDPRPDPRLRSQPTMPIEQMLAQNSAQQQPPEDQIRMIKQEPEVIIHSTSNGNTRPYNLHKMALSLPSVPPYINPSDPKYKDDPRIQRQLSQGKGASDPRAAKRQLSSNDPREKADPRMSRTVSGGTSPHQGSRAMDPRMQKGNSTGPGHLQMPKSEASGPMLSPRHNDPRHSDPRMARTVSAPPLSPAISETSGHMGLPPVLQQPTRTKSDPRQMKAMGLPAFNTGPRDSPPMPSLPPFIPPKPTTPLTKQPSNHSPSHSPKREDSHPTNEPLAHRHDPRFKKKPKTEASGNNPGMSPTSNPDPRQSRNQDSRKTFEHRSPLDAGGKSSSEPSFGSFNRGHNFRQQQHDSKPGRDNQNQRDRHGESHSSGPAPTLPGPARHLGMPQLGMPTRQISRLLPSGGSPSHQFSPHLGTGSPLGGTPENRSPEDDPDKSVRDVFKTIDPTASPFC